MRVVITSDWHLDCNHFGVIDEQGRNSRLVDVEDTITRLIKLCRMEKIDLFVMAGDVFHTNRPSQEAQLAFYRILHELMNSNFDSRFIIGNHDHNSKLGASHALELFKWIVEGSGVRIYDETTWVLEDLTDDDDKLLVCYHPYKGAPPDWSDMRKYGDVNATALVCHSHLEGAVVGAEPFEIRDDVATKHSQLPVDNVWSGHFHKAQLLGDRPLAFYPGSIQAVDFSERNDVKGAVLVDTATQSYRTIGLKTRSLYQIDLEGSADILPSHQAAIRESIVKVNVQLKESEVHLFDEEAIRQKLDEYGAHSVASINLIVGREEVRRDPSINLDTSLTSNFERYVANRDYGEFTQHVLDAGREIIKACTS